MNFIHTYVNFINRLLKPLPHVNNEGGWVAAAIMAGAAIVGALAADDPESGAQQQEVQPRTVSGKTQTDLDFLFDEGAEEAMQAFTDQLDTWVAADRNFFENTFQPFQNRLIDTNASILPVIERTSKASLEAIGKDLVENESMKTAFRTAISAGAEGLNTTLGKFVEELDNLPTEEERVAQAFTTVEAQFGQAGKELTRGLAAQGRAVSQSSARQLAIEKAKAKSGVAGVAGERARAERMTALQSGLGTIAGVQAGATGQLAQLQAGQVAGLATPQVGGVVTPTTDLTQIEAGLVGAGAEKVLGTRQAAESIEHVQKGIKGAVEVTDDFQLTEEEKKRQAAKKKPTSRVRGVGGRTTEAFAGPGIGAPGLGPGLGPSGADAEGGLD